MKLVRGREDEALDIDRGLLTALLEIGHYRNGARSLEKLVSQLRDRGGLTLGRAHLPADNLLALYVDDVPGFQSLIRRSDRFLDQAEKLAPILHEDWRQGLPKKERGAAFDVTYEDLDQEGKAANIAAATRIPEILALAGLGLAGGKASRRQEAVVRRFLTTHVEFLAEAEHKGWEVQKRMEGWTYGPHRDNASRKHPLLVTYAELPEEQKDKDRRTILNYLKYACAAGFKIASTAFMPLVGIIVAFSVVGRVEAGFAQPGNSVRSINIALFMQIRCEDKNQLPVCNGLVRAHKTDQTDEVLEAAVGTEASYRFSSPTAGELQNTRRNATCICRGFPTIEVIVPTAPLPIVEFG